MMVMIGGFTMTDVCMLMKEYQSNYVHDEAKHRNQQQILSFDILRLEESFKALTEDIISDKDKE